MKREARERSYLVIFPFHPHFEPIGERSKIGISFIGEKERLSISYITAYNRDGHFFRNRRKIRKKEL